MSISGLSHCFSPVSSRNVIFALAKEDAEIFMKSSIFIFLILSIFDVVESFHDSGTQVRGILVEIRSLFKSLELPKRMGASGMGVKLSSAYGGIMHLNLYFGINVFLSCFVV